jgi:hypothetical protein
VPNGGGTGTALKDAQLNHISTPVKTRLAGASMTREFGVADGTRTHDNRNHNCKNEISE